MPFRAALPRSAPATRLRAVVATVTALVAWSAGTFLGGSTPASAHNADEILQQVYVTPSARGLDISVEITAGTQVAPGLLSGIDTDNDGAISSSESAAHTDAIRSALSLMFDGQSAPLQVAKTSYPEVALLAAGGGTIILDFTAAAPKAAGPQTFHLSSAYAPTTPTAGALLTKVQANLTPDAHVPIVVESISHPDDGRTLAASYTLSVAAQDAITIAKSATSSAAASTTSGHGALLPAIAAAMVALSAIGFTLRRRYRIGRTTPSISRSHL